MLLSHAFVAVHWRNLMLMDSRLTLVHYLFSSSILTITQLQAGFRYKISSLITICAVEAVVSHYLFPRNKWQKSLFPGNSSILTNTCSPGLNWGTFSPFQGTILGCLLSNLLGPFGAFFDWTNSIKKTPEIIHWNLLIEPINIGFGEKNQVTSILHYL